MTSSANFTSSHPDPPKTCSSASIRRSRGRTFACPSKPIRTSTANVTWRCIIVSSFGYSKGSSTRLPVRSVTSASSRRMKVKDLVPALGPRTDGFATLDSVIRGGAGQGSAVAIREQGVDVTYDQLGARAGALCALLVENGVGRGRRRRDPHRALDRFRSCIPRGSAGWCCPSFRGSSNTLRACRFHSRRRRRVRCGRWANSWTCRLGCASLIPVATRPSKDRWIDAWGAGSSIADLSLDDTAYVVYTSGSTGRPKGCRGHAPRHCAVAAFSRTASEHR